MAIIATYPAPNDGPLRRDLVRHTRVIQATVCGCPVKITGSIYCQRADWVKSVQTTGEEIQDTFCPLTSGGGSQLEHHTAAGIILWTAPNARAAVAAILGRPINVAGSIERNAIGGSCSVVVREAAKRVQHGKCPSAI